MKKLLLVLVSLLMVLSMAGCSKKETATETVSGLNEAQQKFIDAVDVNYAYEFAKKMEGNASNGLGYRTAGSESEFLTGEMIYNEMKAIGLTNVSKDEIFLDGWTFKGAYVTFTDAEGNEVKAELGGYQCDLVTDGEIEVPVVYAGCGTEAELADLDVEGKIVMVDINQSADWWINYPAMEAYLNGALCVMAVQDGGYAEISDEALNAQDICGPAYISAVSISRKDAEAIMSVMDGNETDVKFFCDSTVTLNVPSYNIVGMIEGKNPDQYVLMSGHYDSYFAGFQDDNVAVALVLGVAKGLVDSGYQPEKTLVFLTTAAEEWGTSDTRYDWSTGAYHEVFDVHPEWAGKVVADMNFEMPATGGPVDTLRISYELWDFAYDHAEKVPAVEGAYEEGLKCVPGSTWSDDFSLSIFGIPSSVTTSFDGFKTLYYHSQFDTDETYSEAGYTFNHYLFGTMMIAYDQSAVSPLNFGNRLNALRDSIDEEMMTEEEVKELTAALDEAEKAAEAAYAKVKEINAEYAAAVASGKNAEEVAAKYAEKNDLVLAAFKLAMNDMLCLTWEDSPQFPHEHWTNNLANLKAAAKCLSEGDVDTALDEYLWAIDNNWYAYDWSKKTFDYYTDYVLEADDAHLMWGKGMIKGHLDLYDLIHELYDYEEGDDLSAQLVFINNAISEMNTALSAEVAAEVSDLNSLTEILNAVAE